MKKAVLVAAAVLLGTTFAYSADRGASGYSPGDTMHDKNLKGRGGASRFAPGHEQTRRGGASEFSPGDRMNDKR